MSKYKIAVLASNGYEDSERGRDLINFASKEKDIELAFIDGDSDLENIVTKCKGITALITQGVYKYITDLVAKVDSIKLSSDSFCAKTFSIIQ